MFIGKATKHSLIAVSPKYIAVSPDGHTLFLKDMNQYHKFFRFDTRLIKILFSPRGQSLYCIDKGYNVFHLPTTQKKLTTNSEFELLITLTLRSKFIHIIPFEKVLYIIQDSYILTVKDNEISSAFQFDKSITSVCPITKELATSLELIEPTNPIPFAVLAGDQSGQVSRISFPNNLLPIDKLSVPFISHSDPISLIVQQNKNIMIVGQHGTFFSNSDQEGNLPPPISSVFLADDAGSLLFSSENRLFVSSLVCPSAFQAVSSFPAKILCSSGEFALTDAGYLVSLKSKSPSNLNPQGQFIEYALNKLHNISNEANLLNQELVKSEAKLSDCQLIRAIKSGVDVLDSSIKIIPKISPDFKVTITLEVKIDPKNGYTCKGSSLCLQIKYLTEIYNSSNDGDDEKTGDEINTRGKRSEIISLSYVNTNSVNWFRELKIVSPSPFFVELMMFHDTEVVQIKSVLFDIIDFSFPLELDTVDIGKISPIHSIVRTNPPVSIQFKILNDLQKLKDPNPLISEPHAFVVPYGEHWTMRVDSNVCFVTSGTEATAIAVRSAILRHICIENMNDGEQNTTENLFNEKFSTLQNAGFELAELLEHQPLPTSDLSQKVGGLHSLADQWIQSLI